MTNAQFAALAELIRLRENSAARHAAMLVLVEGMTQADAARKAGTGPQNVNRVIKTCLHGMDLALAVVAGPHPTSTRGRAMTTNKPEVIYLIDTGDGVVWCDDQDPTGYGGCNDAVRYVRGDAYESLQAECDALRAKTSLSLGVGDGTGNLFVHGGCDSIKRVQELIFEREKLRNDARGLIEALELISNTGPNEGTAWFHEIAGKALATHRGQGAGND